MHWALWSIQKFASDRLVVYAFSDQQAVTTLVDRWSNEFLILICQNENALCKMYLLNTEVQRHNF